MTILVAIFFASFASTLPLYVEQMYTIGGRTDCDPYYLEWSEIVPFQTHNGSQYTCIDTFKTSTKSRILWYLNDTHIIQKSCPSCSTTPCTITESDPVE